MNDNDIERKIQAVVFDMDGLMFNTEDIYDRVGATLLARRGHEFTLDLKRRMMGRQNREALQIMIDFCDLKDSVLELNHESNTLFLDMLPQQIEKLPGLEDLLNWLEQTRIPKAVATSSSRVLAEAALGHFDLIPRFEFVLTGDDVKRGKPDPEIYFAAADRLNVTTTRMLVLEDSVNGTRAAVAAGAVTIAVPGHHQDDGEFSHVRHIARALNAPVVWELLEAT
ncbi:MAG: HAD-IA family hydrolase [Pirellulaceae bacterium]|jgi:HAD superfamily hydrolase (TIGR01509 family)|nr:HAD-IA family hydrolase [Pirellulaceae bacterium]